MGDALLAISQTWGFHFDPDMDPFAADDPRVAVCRLFIDFFLGGGAGLLQRSAEALLEHGTASVLFDFKEFAEAFQAHSPDQTVDLVLGLQESPDDFTACAGIAAACALQLAPGTQRPASRLVARFTNVDPVSLSQLKASFVGKFVCVRGTVSRLSAVRPLVREVTFVCGKCGTLLRVKFSDGKFDPPTSCLNAPECKGRTFTLDRQSAATSDFQSLRVQEIDEDSVEAGRIPRTVQVELLDDLVDSCVPGDVVSVCGVVKTINAEVQAGKRGAQVLLTGLFQLYIEANSVTTGRSRSARGAAAEADEADDEAGEAAAGGAEADGLEFTANDLAAFRDLSQRPDCFARLVHSLCPAIFGHELVKAGLVLALFGGSQRYAGDANRMNVRGDSHVLVVGDPGLGKSQMLQALAAAAPRSVYVCGNTTSRTGLTVTLVKDHHGDNTLEAGALVLADQGLCCIDEFDKMGCDSEALLEAMEQQRISVAKAGIVASLCARTAVVAAANPVGGHYDRSRTVSENLKMSSALLSRFDLVFILLDKPDHGHDEMLSEHVMRLHGGPGRAAKRRRQQQQQQPPAQDEYFADGTQRDEAELLGRIREAGRHDPVPVPLLRKYVSYAKKEAPSVVLTPAAADVLQGMYLEMRASSRSTDGTPITTRQLEALIRLAQARARAELSSEVTEAHARDVVSILKDSLLDAFTTEAGELDFGRSGGMSLAKQTKAFLNAAKKAAAQRRSATFSMAELGQVADGIGLAIENFPRFVDSLRDQCYLLKRGHNSYQVQLSEFSQY